MRIEFDGSKTTACHVQRIKQSSAPAALELLANLAQFEGAALPPAFDTNHRDHAALLTYLTQAPPGHWHLGLNPVPPASQPAQSAKIRPLRATATDRPPSDLLLALVSGFLIPDPLIPDPLIPAPLIPAPLAPSPATSPDTFQPAPEPALFINTLVVRQDQRGQGYGTGALRLLGKLAAAHGAKRAYIAISLHNPQARAFYRRQGAKPSELCYWSLSDTALEQSLKAQEAAPTPLYRSLEAAGPGLQSLRGLAGPPLDLSFGYDFGIARFEAWLQTPADWRAQDTETARIMALRQLRLWLQNRSLPPDSPAPRLGLTGITHSLPVRCDPVEASVWCLPL